MDIGDVSKDIKDFFEASITNDINLKERIDTITYYYDKIQSLITKLNQLYNIELNILKNILSNVESPATELFSTSHLTQVQTNIEEYYKVYKENKEKQTDMQTTLPENYTELKLSLYKDVYSTIMNFRTFLLGDGEAIQYRIATKIEMGKKNSFVNEIIINEEDYLKIFRLDRSSMSSAIKGKNIQEILDIIGKGNEKTNAELLQTIIFSNTAKLRQSKLSELYADTTNVTDTTLQKVYNRYNRQKSKNIIPFRNQGSLYEIYVKVKEDPNTRKLNKYLQESSGNVPFYKGGDYKNFQIKLFNASVATLDTMRRALNSIYEILDKNINASKNKSNQEKIEITKKLAQDLINFYTVNSKDFKIADIAQDAINEVIGAVVNK